MHYDDFADKLGKAYTLFLFALSGRYAQMRAPGVEVTPRAVGHLRADCYALGSTFKTIAATEIDNYLNTLLVDASDVLVATLNARKLEIVALVRGIIAENVQQVALLSRTGIGSIASMLKSAHGAIGLLAQQQAGLILYKATDTSGRKWGAKILMTTALRDFAYQSFIDFQMANFANAEIDLIETSKGDVLSVFATEGYPSLTEARLSIFHPNSKTTMEPYVST